MRCKCSAKFGRLGPPLTMSSQTWKFSKDFWNLCVMSCKTFHFKRDFWIPGGTGCRMFEKNWRFLKPGLHVLQDIWIQTRFLNHVLHRLQKVSESYEHFLHLCCVGCMRFQFKQEDFWNSWLKLLKIWKNLKISETCVSWVAKPFISKEISKFLVAQVAECLKKFEDSWNKISKTCVAQVAEGFRKI